MSRNACGLSPRFRLTRTVAADSDGTGGTEEMIGDTSDAQSCAMMVAEQRPDANGATYSNNGGTACYAEFGQTGSTCEPNSPASCSAWQNCMFDAQGGPGSVCSFMTGDGSGGTEAGVGDADARVRQTVGTCLIRSPTLTSARRPPGLGMRKRLAAHGRSGCSRKSGASW